MLRMATLLVGGAIGAGIALLLTPRNGVEMRRDLTNRLNDRYGDQIEKGRLRTTELMQSSREMVDERLAQGQDLLNTAIDKARITIDDVSTAAREVAPPDRAAVPAGEQDVQAKAPASTPATTKDHQGL